MPIYVQGHVCMGTHARGGQKTPLGAVPQVYIHFIQRHGHSLGCITQVGSTGQ